MARPAGLDLGQHADGRADLPGRAVAALEAVLRDEGGLHGVQRLVGGEALDGRHVDAVQRHGEQQAGVRAAPVHEDGAGAALAVVAALLRTRQAEPLAQQVEQRGARVELERVLLAVDVQADGGELGRLGG